MSNRKKVVFGLGVILLAASSTIAERTKAPCVRSVAEAETISKQTGRPMVLDFYADF